MSDAGCNSGRKRTGGVLFLCLVLSLVSQAIAPADATPPVLQPEGMITPAPSSFSSASTNGPASVGALAAPYRALVRDMAALARLSFRTSEDIDVAAKLIDTYDPQAVARGWFAHHAILVANQPAFVTSIRRQAKKTGRRRFLKTIKEDRSVLQDSSGHDAAIQLLLDAVNTEARQMAAMGNLLLARALDLQSERLGDEGLFSQVKAQNALVLAGQYDLSGRYTPRTLTKKAREPLDRVLEIAARLTLEDTDPRGFSRILTVASERRMDYCVNQAKLNFTQCIAGTRHEEERAFCVGRHGIEELGDCWRWILKGS